MVRGRDWGKGGGIERGEKKVGEIYKRYWKEYRNWEVRPTEERRRKKEEEKRK